MNKKLECFGQVFIDEVRDTTISCFEKMIDGRMKGLTAKSVQDKLSGLSETEREIVFWLVVKVVDYGMHNVLSMIESHDDVQLLYDGVNLAEVSDGLAGELYTEDGWIERFSTYFA